MTTNFTKISQLPTVPTPADSDRIVLLTNTDTTPLLQTISFHMLANAFSNGYVNTGSPVISNSMTVNTSFVANSSGVYTVNTYANVITTNAIVVNNNLVVGAVSGYNFSAVALIEIQGNQNTYVQSVIQNANSGTNATGDLVLTADTGNDSFGYVDFGINSSTYSNTQYSITNPLDAYLYSSNSNITIGTASANSIIFHANGTTTTDRKLTINATSVTVANNVLFNANTGTFAGQVNTGSLNVNGNLTVSGNLTLSGNTTFVNATVVTTNDLNIVFANNAASAAAADGAGIVAATYANLVYDAPTSSWQSNVNITPSQYGLTLGNTGLPWNVYANNINVSSVTATANINVGANVSMTTQSIIVSNTISSTLITNNSIYIGNSVSNSFINSTAVYIGGYIVNTVSVSFGNSTVNGAVTNSSIYVANTISNVRLTPSSLFVGNVSSNVYINSTAIFINGAVVNTSIVTFGNSTVNSIVNSTFISLSNTISNVSITPASIAISNSITNASITPASITIGNSTINSVVNSTFISLSNTISNASITPASITIGNSTVNVSTNSTHFFAGNSTVYGFGNSTSDVLVNTTGNLSLTPTSIVVTNSTSKVSVNPSSLTVGNSVSNVSINSTSITNNLYVSSANGYTSLLNGLKMNWGWVLANSSSGLAYFTSPFTTNAFVVTATSNTNVDISYQPSVTFWANNRANILTANATSTNVFWMAIGY